MTLNISTQEVGTANKCAFMLPVSGSMMQMMKIIWTIWMWIAFFLSSLCSKHCDRGYFVAMPIHMLETRKQMKLSCIWATHICIVHLDAIFSRYVFTCLLVSLNCGLIFFTFEPQQHIACMRWLILIRRHFSDCSCENL